MKMKRAFLLLIGVLLLTGTLSTAAQSDPVMVIDTPPPATLNEGDTFTVEFSCRDPLTNEIITLNNGSFSTRVYRASNNEWLLVNGGSWTSPQLAQASFIIQNLVPDFYYLQLHLTGCASINTNTFEILDIGLPKLLFTMQPPSSVLNTDTFDVRVRYNQGTAGVTITLDVVDGFPIISPIAQATTDSSGEAFFENLSGPSIIGTFKFRASATGLPSVDSTPFTVSYAQLVMVIDSPPPPLLYTDETFLVQFSCRDAQTNEIVNTRNIGRSVGVYLASTDQHLGGASSNGRGITLPATTSYLIESLWPDVFYLRGTLADCGSINTADFEIRERPITLSTSAACVGPDLVVNIADGNGPFDISASSGINVPVTGVNTGQTVIAGPDKWDDVTITETGGDLEATNLGTFKCRPSHKPVPQSPAHRATVNTSTPTFTWAGIPDANNYRLFLFDDPVLANRTVDIRENTGSAATSLTPTQSLTPGRYFWRVRGRVNSIWSLWSIRFTLFVE